MNFYNFEKELLKKLWKTVKIDTLPVIHTQIKSVTKSLQLNRANAKDRLSCHQLQTVPQI